MAALVVRTLDWIDDAPVRVEARADSAASPEDVFAILADHEQWPQWFPSVRKVTVLGKAEGVGARRRVSIPGASVDEEFIAWRYRNHPRFRYTVLDGFAAYRLAGNVLRVVDFLGDEELAAPLQPCPLLAGVPGTACATLRRRP